MNARHAPLQAATRDEPPLRLAGAEPADLVSAWLAGLVRVLESHAIPTRDAQGVRDELESHLRERIRDLEVTGLGEDDAVRCAVNELGDVAELARRYREATSFPRRRLLMNLSMFAMAGAAVIVGVATLSQPADSLRVSVFTPAQPTPQEQSALSRKFEAGFTQTPLKDVFAFVGDAIGMPLTVSWHALDEQGVAPDTVVSYTDKNTDFRTLLTQVGEQIAGGASWALDYRVVDGAVRVATDEYFDRREVVLASYDMSPFIDTVSTDELHEVIHTFVYPNGWADNGGTLARMSIVGHRVFIEAPKRYHEQIQWFLDELSKKPGHAMKQNEPAATDLATRVDEAKAMQTRIEELTQRVEALTRELDQARRSALDPTLAR